MLMKLGKQKAVPLRAYHLNRYTAGELPKPPESCDRSDIVTSWGMLGNGPDSSYPLLPEGCGDCTVATVGHAVDLWTAAAGSPRLMTTQEAISAYENFGFDPTQEQPDGSNPTDNGAQPQDILTWWSNEGFQVGGDKDILNGWCGLTPTDATDIRCGINYLGVVYVGLELPVAVQDLMGDNTQVWDLPPGQTLSGDWGIGSLGGHAVPAVGYDSSGVVFISWGQRYKMTWPFWNAYVAETFGLLSRDFSNAVMPDESWAQLQQDMASLQSPPPSSPHSLS